MCPCPWAQRVLLGWAGRGDLGLHLKEQLSLGLDGHQASLLAAGLSPAYSVPAAPAPPSCAPGSVPSGCASSCQDLISLPDAPSRPVISRPDKPQHRLQEPQQKLLGHECKQMKVLPASRGHWLPAGLSELCIFLSSSGTGLQAASTPKGWSVGAGGEMAVCRSSG